MGSQVNDVKSVVRQKNRIPFLQLVSYGFGGIIPIALFNIAGQLIGLIGNISLGLSALWLGVILIIPRLWDAISDPIVGHFSDNFRSRWGRRRPFLLVGGIAVAVSFVLMWWIPDGEWIHSLFPTESGFQWFQLFYILFWLLIFFTACTIFEIPHGALGMEMTTDSHERTRLFSAKSFLGNLFAMSTPWLFALANMEYFKGAGGNEADGMKYVSIMVAAILIPLSFWWFFKVKEPYFKAASKQKKTAFWSDVKHTFKNKTFLRLVIIIFTLAMGFNFVNLLGYYIPIFYVFEGDKVAASTLLGVNGTVWAITGLLAVFPLNWLSPKVGKRKTLLIAIGLMCLAQLSKIVCYNQEYPYLVVIPTILLSAGMLFFFTLGSSMVGDICDEDDLKTGRRSEGSYYSIFWWFIKMGTALASFVAGVLIVFTQFDESQVTSVDQLQGTINEIQDKREAWKTNLENLEDTPAQLVESIKAFNVVALEKATEYKKQLENEISNSEINSVSEQEGLKNYLSQIITTNQKLEVFQSRLDNPNLHNQSSELEDIVKRLNLTLTEVDLIKARNSGEQLLLHLKSKLLENTKSEEHYQKLIHSITSINIGLTDLKNTDNLNVFDKKLVEIKDRIPVLILQSPYTLFMMRAVEIGLPLVLCIISILFTLSYTLTEERCLEIKEALEKRNQAKT
ncbi:MFS transporter [Polaribacter sp. HL-MS24]|uniref:MFS transporter n=1 Tax=Polaribacter sp. HL-MS24 TaxID=3077735 RepID=UPI002934FBA4|nr:MFS transporter [Polaribacter sp. HL-MS24]WOC40879.1 MFS transporter [Polaribacter sp. HL-MS24]